MQHLQTTPVGLSFVVQEIQKTLYAELGILWGDILDGYGLVYHINENNIVSPQAFVGGKNDYSGNLMTTDKSKFFFTKQAKAVHLGDDSFKTSVNLFFVVNLAKAKASILHRAESEVLADVLNTLKNCHTDGVNDTTDKLEEVLREFSNLYRKSKIENMHPHYIFKINIDLVYNINQKC